MVAVQLRSLKGYDGTAPPASEKCIRSASDISEMNGALDFASSEDELETTYFLFRLVSSKPA